MKKVIIGICLLLFASTQTKAQSLLENIGKRVKDKTIEKVEQRIEDKADQAVDKGLDKTEDALKKGTSGKQQKTPQNTHNTSNASPQTQKIDASYAKYDFIPGDEVIFEDDLRGEQKGEFPSKWDLIQGNAEIAQINGENTIAIIGYTYITPLFKNKSFTLPDAFTLEFDILLDDKEGENSIEFLDSENQPIASSLFWKDNNRFLLNWDLSSGEKTSEDTYDNSRGWHHYALSFNKRAMKVYMDAKRVANIPNINGKPAKVRFFARGSEDNSALHIRNIRIAQGAVPLYDRLMTDGRIVTYGIIFDIGKATIKPESMGTINEIYGILKRSPDLKFSIEGHTDNTGNSKLNQTLSESRAAAVMESLLQMGIEGSRLTAKGYGMDKPIDSNDTDEGRAKNRRVEFVKIK